MSTTSPAPVLPDTRTSPKHLQGSYTLPDGSVRIIYGQRVLGQVRFLPGERVFFAAASRLHEDDDRRCRRDGVGAGRADEERHKRPRVAGLDRLQREGERS